MARYTLEPLDAADVSRWDDLIVPYQTAGVFHRTPWLEFLSATRGLTFRRWVIREGSHTVGFFCGATQKKGPFRVLGSPLTGWQTLFMGPILNPDASLPDVLDALEQLARHEGLSVIELGNPHLSDHAMLSAGYQIRSTQTLVVPLTPGDPDAMWKALATKCRNQVRKAQKAGLEIEDTTSPDIVDEYYDQYTAAMERRGVPVQYPRDHAHTLFAALIKADLLFAVRVKDRSGRVLATGLFPHDHRAVYYWAGASWPDGRDRCPNDLLQWHLMCLAADRGLTQYDMCGTGHFKSKFGGTPAPWTRWRRFYRPTARWAWHAYELYATKRRDLAFRLSRASHSRKGAAN